MKIDRCSIVNNYKLFFGLSMDSYVNTALVNVLHAKTS